MTKDAKKSLGTGEPAADKKVHFVAPQFQKVQERGRERRYWAEIKSVALCRGGDPLALPFLSLPLGRSKQNADKIGKSRGKVEFSQKTTILSLSFSPHTIPQNGAGAGVTHLGWLRRRRQNVLNCPHPPLPVALMKPTAAECCGRVMEDFLKFYILPLDPR